MEADGTDLRIEKTEAPEKEKKKTIEEGYVKLKAEDGWIVILQYKVWTFLFTDIFWKSNPETATSSV